MFRPLPHQELCLQALEKTRSLRHDRGLVVMAPGLGKTFTAAFDAHNFLYQNDFENKKILFLCHQNDILEQGRNTFQQVFGEGFQFGMFNGVKKQFTAKDGLFASFQTIKDSLEFFGRDHFAYIVVDESHHSMASTYKPVIDYFKPQFLLGITATPDRADLLDIRQIYGEEVFSLSLEEALVQGLLTPVDYRMITDDFDDSKLLDRAISKLSIQDLNRTLFVPKRDEEIASIVKEHMKEIKNPLAMIFCPTVKYCNHICEYFDGALAIHSRLPRKVQQERLLAFRRGEARIAVTVDKFNEGIDIPEANLIVFLRSTNSLTVFLQQLGRGLRKMSNKANVRILDFVANCERLEMVQRLANRIEQHLPQSGNGDNHNESGGHTVYFDLNSIAFTEVHLKILDVLAAMRAGYTKAILIRQLQSLAEELGRSPTGKDIIVASKAGLVASPSTFSIFFGSFNNALKAAELEIVQVRGFSDEELISQLKTLHAQLGRSPTVQDVAEASKKSPHFASPSVYHRAFGGMVEALKQAGFEPNVTYWDSEEELINLLKKFAEKLGRAPYIKEIDEASKEGLMPASNVYRARFGTHNKALLKAGLQPYSQTGHTRESLIKLLQTVTTELGHTPSRREWDKAARKNGRPTSATIAEICGSWDEAIIGAGFKSQRKVALSKEELLNYLRVKAKELGRNPTRTDITQDAKEGKCPNWGTFRNRLGLWKDALKEAGLAGKQR